MADLPVFVVPLALAIFQLVGSAGADQRMRHQMMPLDALGWALVLAGPAALVARRRRPVATLTAVTAITVTYVLRGYVFGPVFLSLVAAIIAAVSAGRRAAAWIVSAAGFTVLNAVAAVAPAGPFRLREWSAGHTIGVSAWWLLVLTGAELVRIRSERAAEARRVLAEEERRRASEERLRIARELHDVLAHNISLINVQAGVALHLLEEHPEHAQGALTAIKAASREALNEVRSVLGILRQAEDGAPRAPTAGLDQLGDLLAGARAAGITVERRIRGDRRPLPPEIDLAAFRIIQEALTNVTRHAGPGVTAVVDIRYEESALTILVEDDGQGVPGDLPQGGDGIAGMRERVSALGGELAAGPRPGHRGFRVRAVLPVARSRPERRADRRRRGGGGLHGPSASTSYPRDATTLKGDSATDEEIE